ncbi:hypothetical protein H6G81_27255 [Scytonema hofmannii FACHB-248]|uniref:Uncharacterized protein n=1 Tax=Scytonema hofmannii FACHB-248 TaxID=1842502 RepID=A0ABR8GZA0_9CYAN|nr:MULTISPECIES: hypothetical protein [Nostocales]MBD2608113.1 hypothetical protein [Scytonema hofmannii FACHB-248]
MLLEKDAIQMEDAINLLESNGMKPNIRQLGSQKTLITKLVDGYSLMIEEDKSSPGYLCAYLKSSERGTITIWHEISYKSLTSAIKYIQEQLGIASRKKLFGEYWTVVVAVVSLALAGTSYLLVSNKLTQCNTQQSEQPIIQP